MIAEEAHRSRCEYSDVSPSDLSLVSLLTVDELGAILEHKNTLGGHTEAFDVTGEVRDLVERASSAVGGGLLGVDLMETGSGYTVHEVNSTCEWKGLDAATPDVDVPARIVDWIERRAEGMAA